MALSIAAAKAVLIAAFFMHLVEQPSVSRWAFAFGLVLAGILFAMVFLDVVTRERPALRQPGVPAASAARPDGIRSTNSTSVVTPRPGPGEP